MQHIYQNIKGFLTEDHPKVFSTFLKSIPDNSVWVEIGSFLGKSISYCVVESKNLNKNIKFHCIDPWKSYEELTTTFKKLDEEYGESGVYTKFLNNVAPIKEYINVHRMKSQEASKKFEDKSIDVIFIDGAHDYENVKIDCNVWYSKMKSDGVMIFDDCKPKVEGVWKAVTEFLKEKNLTMSRSGRVAYTRLK
jgi:hypothetical protein